MAISENITPLVNDASTTATSFTETVTLAAGTSRKCVVFVGMEDAVTDFTGVTFDGNAMTAPGGAGSPARINDVIGRLYYYDISDGISTGSKDIVISLDGSEQTVSWAIWILNGAATGAFEDLDSTTDGGTTTNLSLTLTNASTSYVGAALINGAVGTDVTTWGSDLTEFGDLTGISQRIFAADGTGTANATASTVSSSTSNDKVFIAWAVAEAAAASGGGIGPLVGSGKGLVG